jgi:hypothetical protein
MHCLAALGAGDRCRVEQPQLILARGGIERDSLERLDDPRQQPAHPLVVAGLFGAAGKELREPPAGDGEKAPIAGTVEQHLGDSETDDLGVRGLGSATRALASRQGIIDVHVKCSEQVVEVRRHTDLLVGVALATPDFDGRCLAHSIPATIPTNSESTI